MWNSFSFYYADNQVLFGVLHKVQVNIPVNQKAIGTLYLLEQSCRWFFFPPDRLARWSLQQHLALSPITHTHLCPPLCRHRHRHLHSSWWAGPNRPVWDKQNVWLMRTDPGSARQAVPCTEQRIRVDSQFGGKKPYPTNMRRLFFSYTAWYCLCYKAAQCPSLQCTRPSPVLWEQLKYEFWEQWALFTHWL